MPSSRRRRSICLAWPWRLPSRGTDCTAKNGNHPSRRQPLHDVDGRYIDIAFGTTVVRLAGEDGRDVPIKRLIVERLASADLMCVAAEPGGKLMIHGLSFLGLGFPRSGSAALKPCPSARPGVQPEWAASRGTGCTERGTRGGSWAEADPEGAGGWPQAPRRHGGGAANQAQTRSVSICNPLSRGVAAKTRMAIVLAGDEADSCHREQTRGDAP